MRGLWWPIADVSTFETPGSDGRLEQTAAAMHHRLLGHAQRRQIARDGLRGGPSQGFKVAGRLGRLLYVAPYEHFTGLHQ
mgnify:CR=1 FL=1